MYSFKKYGFTETYPSIIDIKYMYKKTTRGRLKKGKSVSAY